MKLPFNPDGQWLRTVAKHSEGTSSGDQDIVCSYSNKARLNGQCEPAPSSTPCVMDEGCVWTGNTFHCIPVP